MAERLPRAPVAVWRAIRAYGTQNTMALSLRVAQQTVSDWGSGRKPVPAEYCPTIERETRALSRMKQEPALLVTCEELRPDIPWSMLRLQAEGEPA